MFQPFDPSVNALVTDFTHQTIFQTSLGDFQIIHPKGYWESFPPHIGDTIGLVQIQNQAISGVLGGMKVTDEKRSFIVIRDFRLSPTRRVINQWIQSLPQLIKDLACLTSSGLILWPFWQEDEFLKNFLWNPKRPWNPNWHWHYLTNIDLNIVFDTFGFSSIPDYWELVPVNNSCDELFVDFIQNLERYRNQPLFQAWRWFGKMDQHPIQVLALRHKSQNRYYCVMALSAEVEAEVHIHHLNPYHPQGLVLTGLKLLKWFKSSLGPLKTQWKLRYLSHILTWNNDCFVWALQLLFQQLRASETQPCYLAYLKGLRAYRLDLNPRKFLYMSFPYKLLQLRLSDCTQTEVNLQERDIWIYYHPAWVI